MKVTMRGLPRPDYPAAVAVDPRSCHEIICEIATGSDQQVPQRSFQQHGRTHRVSGGIHPVDNPVHMVSQACIWSPILLEGIRRVVKNNTDDDGRVLVLLESPFQ